MMSDMTLKRFGFQLQQTLRDKDAYSHPFVCTGSPPVHGVFIVGHNAATRLSEQFSNYWSDVKGFDKPKFLRDYRSQPRREGKLKGARQRIEVIADIVSQENLLDTNIYTHSTETEAQLERQNKTTNVFEFLLTTLEPQVVLAHGWKAIKFFRRRCVGIIHATTSPQLAKFNGVEFELICTGHLSRMALDAAENIGRSLQQYLRGRVEHLG